MRKSAKDYIQEFLPFLNLTIVVDDFTDLGGGYWEIETKNTLHLRKLRVFNYNGTKYKVQELEIDKSITLLVKEGAFNIINEIVLEQPFFFYGTPILTSKQRNLIKNSVNKCPFIYLYEVVTEEHDLDRANPTMYTANVRLFFMDDSDSNAWLTKNHYDEVIEPIRSLVFNLIDAMKFSRITRKITKFTTVNHANWGVTSQQGHLKNIFNEKLSGVELRIEIPIERTFCNT